MVDSWNEGVCNINRLEIIFSKEIISQDTNLPNVGIEVRREGKINKMKNRDKFLQTFMQGVSLDNYQMGVMINCIPEPWKEVANALIRSISL